MNIRKTGIRKPGQFCWFNLLSPRPSEGRGFFAALLGWRYEEIPGLGGHTVLVDGHPIGTFFENVAPSNETVAPDVYGMIKVEAASKTCETVRSMGGKAQPPVDLGDVLRQAYCHEPEGAKFDLWESKKAEGTDVDSDVIGAPSWYQLMTRNVDHSVHFYSRVFGWTAEVAPGMGGYTNFKLGESYVAGMMPILPEMGGIAPSWHTFFTVKDVEESLREASKLGGKVVVPLQNVPGVCQFGGVLSPHGVPFHVVDYAR